MGGYKTQTRTLTEYGSRTYKLAHWANPISGQVPTVSGTQTTYSYRDVVSADNTATAVQDQRPGPHGSPPRNPLHLGLGARGAWAQTPYDSGHDFDTFREKTVYSHPSFRLSNLAGTSYYEGPLVLDKSLVSWIGSAPPWSSSAAGVIGAQFIRATRPTAPSAQLATAFGEIFADGRVASIIGGSLMSDKLNVFRKAGGEYLNVTFGWLPFLADLLDVLNAVVNSRKIIEQYVRDSGQIVRRRRSYSPINTHEPVQTFSGRELVFPVSGFGSYIEPDAQKRRGTLTVRSWRTEKYSFSAAYTYYLDTGGDFFSDLRRFEQLANRLLGTRITPEVLWELVPFSWLVDWMSSTGVYISNYSSFNGDELVLRYGYVMRQLEHWRQISFSGASYGGKSLGTVTETLSSIRKSRVRSTPYGFGLNPDAFNARQWAILAALGLTKAPNKLVD